MGACLLAANSVLGPGDAAKSAHLQAAGVPTPAPPPPHPPDSSHSAGCAVAGRTGELGDVLGFRPFRGRPVLQFPHLENGANEECSLGLSHRAHPTRLHRLRLLLKMK